MDATTNEPRYRVTHRGTHERNYLRYGGGFTYGCQPLMSYWWETTPERATAFTRTQAILFAASDCSGATTIELVQ
jgi:hypothetical protein